MEGYLKKEYLKERKKWKNFCKAWKKEYREIEMGKLRLIKAESEVWGYLNKFRKKNRKK